MRFLFLLAAFAGLTLPALADTLIVANKYEGTVSFIDLDSGEEVARPETGASPHEVALSPDGSRVVVVSYMEDGYIGRELNVFDVATATLIETIDIDPHLAPHGIAWLGDSDAVIVTTEETRDVIRVEVTEGLVTGSAVTDQIGSHLLALSPGASIAYVTSRGSDTITVIETGPMTVLETIEADEGPEGVFVSPDGSELWVGNNRSETIIIYDTSDMTRLDTIDTGFLPIRVRFSPDGTVVAVADLRGDRIVLYDAASRRELAAVDVAEVGALAPASLLWAPDGSAVYAGAQDGARVVEIEADNWTIARVFEAGLGSDGLEISPVTVQH
jgi:YVTN family beta-propeller protein